MERTPSWKFPAWRATSVEGDKVHLKTCDGRTFEMWRWEARQMVRELLIAFNVIEAYVIDEGKKVDIFTKDNWLIKTRLDINRNPVCCDKSEQTKE